jgi:hypothetical protein
MKKLYYFYFATLALFFIVLCFAAGRASGLLTPVSEMDTSGGFVSDKPVPDWINLRAKNYIIGILGKGYFDSYFNFKNSFAIPDEAYAYSVEYEYEMPFEGIDYLSKRVILELDKNGKVLEYSGPKKRYSFRINKNTAINIARAAGVKEADEATIRYIRAIPVFGPPTKSGFGEKEKFFIVDDYVWIVSGGSVEGGGRYYAYIDLDSGELRALVKDTGARSGAGKVLIEPTTGGKLEGKENVGEEPGSDNSFGQKGSFQKENTKENKGFLTKILVSRKAFLILVGVLVAVIVIFVLLKHLLVR